MEGKERRQVDVWMESKNMKSREQSLFLTPWSYCTHEVAQMKPSKTTPVHLKHTAEPSREKESVLVEAVECVTGCDIARPHSDAPEFDSEEPQ